MVVDIFATVGDMCAIGEIFDFVGDVWAIVGLCDGMGMRDGKR